MRPNRKARRRIQAEKGFGPRHAFNAQEGDELVPEELPSPPAWVEQERLRRRRHAGRDSLMNLHPANLAEAFASELGGLTKEDVAKLGISLLMGGEGPEPMGVPPSAKVKQPGLKVPDMAPRYEGPPEAAPEKPPLFGSHQDLQDWLTLPKAELQKKYGVTPPDNTFPSLNKPPYDALKEEGPISGLGDLIQKHINDPGKSHVPLEMDMTEPLPGQVELGDKGIFKPDPSYLETLPPAEQAKLKQEWEGHLQAMQEYQGYVNDPHVIKPMSYEQFAKEEHGIGAGMAPEGSTAHMSPQEALDHLGPGNQHKHFEDMHQAYRDATLINAEAADLYEMQFGEKPENTFKYSELLKGDGWTKQGDHYVPPDYMGPTPEQKAKSDAVNKQIMEEWYKAKGLEPPKNDPGGDAFDEHMDELLNGPKEEKYIDNPYYKDWSGTDLSKIDFDKPLGEQSTAHMSPSEAADHLLDTHNPQEAHDKHFEDISKAYEEDKPINAKAAESEDYEMWHADEPSQLYSDFLKKQGWVKKGDHYVPPGEVPPDEGPPIDPWEPGAPRFRKGTSGVRQPRKFRSYPPVRKVGVQKGYGPRHAANSKEGEMPDLTQVNTDTVPAMLTPREAVLNRNAAELAGRDNIEQLNQEGNQLARKGVDLASGESNIPDPKASDRRLAGTGAASYLTRELFEKYGGSPTAFELVPDFVKYLEQEVDPKMVQKGTANMKPKPKSSNSKPKPSAKPAPPQSGSPYVQGFQQQMKGYQGGDASLGMPGMQSRDFPHPMAGQMHNQGAMPGGYGYQPQPAIEPGGMPGAAPRNFPHPNAGLMHPQIGGAISYGGPPPFQIGGALSGGTPGGGGLYPPGQGPFGKVGQVGQYAGGTNTVGATNPETVYGPPITLSAGDLSRFQQAAQQAGLSQSQIMGLMQAAKGLQQGYGAATGAGSMADMATAASVGAQGGISDIGYPPMIAPNAEWHTDGGGWRGPYDPDFMFPGYAGGSRDVGNFAANPELFYGPDFRMSGSGFRGGGGLSNRSSYNPGAWSGGAPGMPWSPTRIPTTYDPQGYPYGVPVQGPDQNVQGVGRTHNLRQNQ